MLDASANRTHNIEYTKHKIETSKNKLHNIFISSTEGKKHKKTSDTSASFTMSTLFSTSSNHSTGTKKDRSAFCSIAAEIHELGPFIHPPCPNPAPLGLFAFGLTTALLQVKHTRLGGDTQEDSTGVENLVWGFAVFFGGESYCTIFSSQLCPCVLCVFLQTIDLTIGLLH